jgi:hypothetical protein
MSGSLWVTANSTEDLRGLAVATAFMGLCSLVYAITRATAVRRTFATSRLREPTTFELFRAVVRRQRGRTLAFAAGCALSGLAIARLPFAFDIRLLFGITPALMLSVAVVGAWQLHRLAGLRSTPDLAVSAHGRFLFVARGPRLVGWVVAPLPLISAVSTLPSARVRTRAS